MTQLPLFPGDRPSPIAPTSPKEFAIVSVRELHTAPLRSKEPHDIVRYWHSHIVTATAFNHGVESLVAILLNTKLRIIGHHVVSMGTLNECMAHPRECFRAAIIGNAYTVILAHNHPSGDPQPSHADRNMTQRMKEAGILLSLHLTDHLIIGNSRHHPSYFSFREAGLV